MTETVITVQWSLAPLSPNVEKETSFSFEQLESQKWYFLKCSIKAKQFLTASQEK